MAQVKIAIRLKHSQSGIPYAQVIHGIQVIRCHYGDPIAGARRSNLPNEIATCAGAERRDDLIGLLPVNMLL